MKFNLLPTLALLFLLAVSNAAFAGSTSAGTVYIGGQATTITVDEDNLSEFEPTAAVGRAGFYISDNVAIEGRYGFGLSDDTVSGGISGELDNFVGGYVSGHLPLADRLSLYGVVGYTNAKVTLKSGGLELSASDSGLSYGAGVNFFLLGNLGLNAEYMQYLSESGYDLSAVSLGVVLNF